MIITLQEQLDQLRLIQQDIITSNNECNKTLLALDIANNIKNTLMESTTISLSETEYKFLSLLSIEETCITLGMENFNIHDRAETVKGCENIIATAMKKLVSFLKYIIDKLKLFFKKIKEFVINLFNTKEKKMIRIKEQLGILDKLATNDKSIKKELSKLVQSVISTKVAYVDHDLLKEASMVTVEIIEEYLQGMLAVDDPIDDANMNYAAYDSICTKYLNSITEPELKVMMKNILDASSVELKKTTFSELFNYKESDKFTSASFYEKFYNELKDLAKKGDDFVEMIDGKFLKIKKQIATINGDQIIPNKNDRSMLSIKLIGKLNLVINKSFTNELISISQALTKFENGVNKYIELKFNNDIEVIGAEDPTIVKRVFTYEGIGVYISENALVDKMMGFNAFFYFSPLSARSHIFTTSAILKLPDDSKNWILAHELGHGVFQHVVSNFVSAKDRFKSIKELIETLKNDTDTDNRLSEYEADAYAYKKYGYEITIKTLTLLGDIFPLAKKDAPSHPSIANRIKAIEILEEQSKSKN